MPDPYDLHSRRPDPLIPRDCVFGVRERIGPDGNSETPVDEASVLAALEKARAAGAQGVVIAFINAYRNPEHERKTKAIVERAAPGLPVFCSSDVWPVIREYERTVTATIAGYVQARVANYLSTRQAALEEAASRASR